MKISKAWHINLAHKWLPCLYAKELVVILADLAEQAHFEWVDVVVGKLGPPVTSPCIREPVALVEWRPPIHPDVFGRVSKYHPLGCLTPQKPLGRAHLPLEVTAGVVRDATE